MEYRAYFFTNMYISDIQRGIQTAHCISDMHEKYKGSIGISCDILTNWAKNDKTMIVLNGGYSSHLKDLINEFDNCNLPWDSFYESTEALDGALTCVGIIIPEYIYENAKIFNTLSDDEKERRFLFDIQYNGIGYKNSRCKKWLIENLSNYRLA